MDRLITPTDILSALMATCIKRDIPLDAIITEKADKYKYYINKYTNFVVMIIQWDGPIATIIT